jgi:hypothetical protein
MPRVYILTILTQSKASIPIVFDLIFKNCIFIHDLCSILPEVVLE